MSTDHDPFLSQEQTEQETQRKKCCPTCGGHLDEDLGHCEDCVDARETLLSKVASLEQQVAEITKKWQAEKEISEQNWCYFLSAGDQAAAAESQLAAMTQEREDRLVQEKPCCTICDARKHCHVCGNQTLYACADCRIDLDVSVYVCTSCRDEHEQKCPARLLAHCASLEQQVAEERMVREAAELAEMAYLKDLAAAESQLAEMTKANQRNWEKLVVEHVHEVQAITAHYKAADAALVKMREYAQHKDECPEWLCATCGTLAGSIAHMHGRHAFAPKPCTCGLSALLDPQDQP